MACHEQKAAVAASPLGRFTLPMEQHACRVAGQRDGQISSGILFGRKLKEAHFS